MSRRGRPILLGPMPTATGCTEAERWLGAAIGSTQESLSAHGPTGTSTPRVHAFPHGSNVSLCGRRRGHDERPVGERCLDCQWLATRKSFVAR
jgi:hypothetical protein